MIFDIIPIVFEEKQNARQFDFFVLNVPSILQNISR